MTTRNMSAKLLGREVDVEYSSSVIAYAILTMRVAMGWIFFQAGIEKLLDPEWTAAGYLQFAIHENNPFTALWANFAGSPTLDLLVMWGLALTGLGIILGALLRWNAFWAAIMMLFFWASALQGGLSEFLPLEHGWVFDDHLVYASLVFGLGAALAGLAGIVMVPIWGLRPHVGVDVVIPAFLIIVLGGVGSFWGAVVAAVLIGLSVGLTGAYASAWSMMSMYILLILVVGFRTRGLFGKKSALEN